MKCVYENTDLNTKISSWLTVASAGEIALVVSFVGSGVNTRVRKLAEDRAWLKLLSSNKFEKAIAIDLRGTSSLSKKLEEANDLLRGEFSKTVILINGWEEVVTRLDGEWLSSLQNWRNQGIGVVCITSKNLLNGDLYEDFFNSISFSPVVLYFGTWSVIDMQQAVVQKAVSWGYQISDDEANRIAMLSGGNMGIAKRLAWHYVLGERKELDNMDLVPDTLLLLERIWQSFDEVERYFVLDYMSCKKVDNKRLIFTETYLRELGLLGQNNYGFLTPIWRKYIEMRVIDERKEKVDAQHLIIDGVDVSRSLPEKQLLILRELMLNTGKIVSREDLVDKVWENQDVSDWAIDGQVSRIRKRLKELGVGARRLVTKRNEGYLWQDLN